MDHTPFTESVGDIKCIIIYIHFVMYIDTLSMTVDEAAIYNDKSLRFVSQD